MILRLTGGKVSLLPADFLFRMEIKVMDIIEQKLDEIIAEYNYLMTGIEQEALTASDRYYGGVIRAGKGKFLEKMTEKLVEIAWTDVLKQNPERMKINKKKMPIGITEGYPSRISDEEIKKYVEKHRSELV